MKRVLVENPNYPYTGEEVLGFLAFDNKGKSNRGYSRLFYLRQMKRVEFVNINTGKGFPTYRYKKPETLLKNIQTAIGSKEWVGISEAARLLGHPCTITKIAHKWIHYLHEAGKLERRPHPVNKTHYQYFVDAHIKSTVKYTSKPIRQQFAETKKRSKQPRADKGTPGRIKAIFRGKASEMRQPVRDHLMMDWLRNRLDGRYVGLTGPGHAKYDPALDVIAKTRVIYERDKALAAAIKEEVGGRAIVIAEDVFLSTRSEEGVSVLDLDLMSSASIEAYAGIRTMIETRVAWAPKAALTVSFVRRQKNLDQSEVVFNMICADLERAGNKVTTKEMFYYKSGDGGSNMATGQVIFDSA